MADGRHPFQRAERSGHKVSLGWPCWARSHRLAMLGRAIVIFDGGQAGGLNEFGMAAYKATQILRGVRWTGCLGGGIEINLVKRGRDFRFQIARRHGLCSRRWPRRSARLKLEDEDLQNVENAVDFVQRHSGRRFAGV